MAKQELLQPEIFDYSGDISKAWYIGFRYTHPATNKRIQVQIRGNLNYCSTVGSRREMANGLLTIIRKSLKDGWVPWNESFDSYIERLSSAQEPDPITDINRKTFNQAIDFAMDNGTWAKNTKDNYRCTAKFAKTAAEKLKLDGTPIQEISSQHVMLILNQIKKAESWSNKAYNKNKGYLCAIIGVVKKWKIITMNPAEGIDLLPVTETEGYQPYTFDEKIKIAKCLKEFNYRYFVLHQIIYHTGIRPFEVLALRIEDIRFATNEIVIVPNSDRENSKTKNVRYVPINPHLKELLSSLDFDIYPSNYYIFGSPYKSGRGNSGKGVRNPEYFKPSETRIKIDTITKLWKELIWKGLGIHKYQYGAKHTGSDDKLLAGIELDALRDMYGHASKFMTEKYTTKLKEINKKKIIDNSPAFV